MKIKNLLSAKTVVQQANAIKSKYPKFSVYFDAVHLKAIGKIQPTSRSQIYTVEIVYRLYKFPEIKILEPKLIRNFKDEKIPHMYFQKTLCLFMPKYREFKRTDFISDTIIPWTSLWLYHYEIWHSTGEWLGGGEHPIA